MYFSDLWFSDQLFPYLIDIREHIRISLFLGWAFSDLWNIWDITVLYTSEKSDGFNIREILICWKYFLRHFSRLLISSEKIFIRECLIFVNIFLRHFPRILRITTPGRVSEPCNRRPFRKSYIRAPSEEIIHPSTIRDLNFLIVQILFMYRISCIRDWSEILYLIWTF